MKQYYVFYKVLLSAKNEISAKSKADTQLSRLKRHSQVENAKITAVEEFTDQTF